MRDMSPNNNGEMILYVSVDAKTWAKAQFPHASSARLRENAYTIVESTTYSLAVDVVLQDQGSIGTLFMSNSNGTFFVESLKDTNRNSMGYVDYERIYGVQGVGLANVVANAKDVEGQLSEKLLKTLITFDDGLSLHPRLYLSAFLIFFSFQAATGGPSVHLKKILMDAPSLAIPLTSTHVPSICTPSPTHTIMGVYFHPRPLASSWVLDQSEIHSCRTRRAIFF